MMRSIPVSLVLLSAGAVFLGGCHGPGYVYRTDDTVYVVQATAGPEEIARPADHRIEVRYVGAALVDAPGGEFLRLLFDARGLNESTLPMELELRGVELRDASGRMWPAVPSEDQEGRLRIEGGAERVASLAFDLPEETDFAQHPRFEMSIPYSIGGGLHLARIRLTRDLVPEPPPPPPHYHRPYWHDPWYGPQFHFGGVFHFD